MADLLRITGGTVFDPANGIDGHVRDLWIAGDKIVAAPHDPAIRPTREIDARGLVIMPGGVDIHCHIAGPKVNVARKMRPEEKRGDHVLHKTAGTHSGSLGSVPSTFATGYQYAGMGYTTAFDAAIPPLAARHAHEEFADTPCIDKGFYVLMGNNHYAASKFGSIAKAATSTDWTKRSITSALRRGRSSAACPRPRLNFDCRTPCTSIATTWACRATGKPRWKR
jgi:formylmethanofuran dehydrogenase subunit A